MTEMISPPILFLYFLQILYSMWVLPNHDMNSGLTIYMVLEDGL